MEQLFKEVELKISCRGLKDADVLSKSDPFVIFKIKDSRTGAWNQIGQTEIQKNQLNPNFKQGFKANYFFEEKQECHFEVLDYDSSGSHDHLGECFTTLSAIVGARNNTFISDLTNKKTGKKILKSKMIVMADSFKECNDLVYMEWIGVKLANTDGWFDKSDPFLRLLRLRPDGSTYILAEETDKIMDCLNPVWKGQKFSVSKLCNGEMHREIRVECWDWQKDQNHRLIGSAQFTIDQLINGQREFQLTHPKRSKPGKLALRNFEYIRKPSFLEYIRGNTQLNLTLAVDFTASNGAVSTPESLHYLNPNFMNAYQQAIFNVGEILLDYDFDKKVPCFGFGGVPRYPNYTFPSAQHCFPLSGNPQEIEVLGLPQIMGLYQYALTHVSLSGPTFFTPIIQEACRIATISKQQGSQSYSILLILTDGEIHDMDTTVDSVVFASQLPLSIIIIGIGSASFANMEKLDGDNGQLVNSQGQKPVRDVVQFVEYKNFLNNLPALTQQVLAEIPNQLVDYMTYAGIKPSPPPQANIQAM